MNADKISREQEASNRHLAFSIAVAAGIVAVILRLVPHPTNFSSVGAASLFGGARLRVWQSILLSLGVMVLSDLALWVLSGFDFNYSLGHPSRFFVYGSFMIYVLIGRWLRNTNSIGSIALAATLGGLQFFIITNFCEWLFQPWYFDLVQEPYRYSRDLNGLAMCFVKALPFYQGETPFGEHPFAMLTDFKLTIVWTILGDIVFTTGYFLLYAKLAQPVYQTEQIPVPAPNA